MDFDRELRTYQEHLMELVASEGSFVVIRDEDLAGPFESYTDALRAGYAQFGVVPFLVKQIHRPDAEPVHYFSRDFPQCTS